MTRKLVTKLADQQRDLPKRFCYTPLDMGMEIDVLDFNLRVIEDGIEKALRDEPTDLAEVARQAMARIKGKTPEGAQVCIADAECMQPAAVCHLCVRHCREQHGNGCLGPRLHVV